MIEEKTLDYDEALARLAQANGSKWGMVYTWVRQGVLRSKDFEKLILHFSAQKSEQYCRKEESCGRPALDQGPH